MVSALVDGLFSGISIGSVLLLSALGLAIVFGLMGVINMAHGELMMLGAYTTVLVQGALKETPLFEGYIFVALIAAFCVTALFGLLLERSVIRFLYGRPLETLLATWGVSLILQQLVRSVSWQFVVGLVVAALLSGIGWADVTSSSSSPDSTDTSVTPTGLSVPASTSTSTCRLS